MLTVRTPGKLMIAGEYAILEPFQSLVVTAVNRFVYTTIKKNTSNELVLKDFRLPNIRWQFKNNAIFFHYYDNRLRFVKNAMEVTFQYLHGLGTKLYPVVISVKSELNDKTGIKYGLGSSAAVTTGVVRAILEQFLPKPLNNIVLFKLAAIAHVRTQGNGSGADVAASTFGGVLEYQSFQAEWLLPKIQNTKQLCELVDTDWPFLSIEQLQFPTDTAMLVGWTGQAASTREFVSRVRRLKVSNPTAYEDFLQQSTLAVNRVLQGMRHNNQHLFFAGIEQNRVALAELGKAAHVQIETDSLHQLSQLASKCRGAGKLSGAGGGDCGIAFVPAGLTETSLKEKWEQAGIKTLDLRPFAGADIE